MTAARPGLLRVVTINTGKCDGRYRDRLNALLAGLAALDADIILAQEAFAALDAPRAPALSTPRHLADGLGMHLAFHPIRHKPRDVEGVTVDSVSGLATLSRWPLGDVTTVALTDDPEDGDRAALFVEVPTPDGVVRTANTHLTHLRHRDDLRIQQAREILDHPWWHGEGALRLLGGDMNARDGHEVHTLVRGGDTPWTGSDAFDAAGDPARSATIRREAPGGVIEARLDYLYLLEPSGTPAPAVAGARVVLDSPLGDVLPSDHFGVLADIRLG